MSQRKPENNEPQNNKLTPEELEEIWERIEDQITAIAETVPPPAIPYCDISTDDTYSIILFRCKVPHGRSLGNKSSSCGQPSPSSKQPLGFGHPHIMGKPIGFEYPLSIEHPIYGKGELIFIPDETNWPTEGNA